MPRRRSPALTDAEARVMTVLWQRKTATVADVALARVPLIGLGPDGRPFTPPYEGLIE